MPNEIFTINLNAQAIIPEAFILLGIVGTLLVDLAGEKTASKWAPIICYLSIGSSLLVWPCNGVIRRKRISWVL